MKISEGVEWGIHCALLLAACEQGESIPGKALAASYGLSESYLVKHLKALVAAGILQSVSGPYGGYRLALPPEKITLLDIVEAIEGNDPVFRCQEIRKCGEITIKDKRIYQQLCEVNNAMLRAEQAYREALAKETLANIQNDFTSHADTRLLKRIGDWLGKNTRKPTTK